MKKMYMVLAAFLMTAMAFSQETITGTILDGETSDPLPGASIVVKGTTKGATTDFDGKFSLSVTDGSGTLVISYMGYVTKNVAFKSAGSLGSISLEPDAEQLGEVVVVGSGIIDLAGSRQTPIAVSTITVAEIQTKGVGNVEFPEIMKNTPNVYVSNQAGGFGDSQMYLRGFSQSNTAFLLNGQPINGMEDGKMYWSNWSGMTDVANAVQVQRGLGSSKLAISSVGGTINIVSKSLDREQGGFVRFITGNDSYAKTTVSYDSGLQGKWAYSIMLDHWQAHRKYASGTSGQGQNYFFSVGYVPNENHTINFLLTGAPQWHGQNYSKDLEEYEQYGEKYNDNAGFLDGEWTTWRKNYYHKPIANLNWDWDISDNKTLSTVLYASWGRGGGTGALGASSDTYNLLTSDKGLADFDAVYANNLAESDANNLGSYSNGGVIRSSVNNHNWYGLITNYNYDTQENWSFNVGADFRFYKGTHFRQLVDLLGLDGFKDNYKSARRDSDYVLSETFKANPWSALFDYADSDQRYDRDYSEWINYQGIFAQAEYANNGFSGFFQGALSNQSYQREERYTTPTDEKSDKINKIGYNLKGGLAYEFIENHKVFANAGYYSRQPFLDNIFDNVTEGNDLVDNGDVDNEEVLGLEAGYTFKSSDIVINLNAYYTNWKNRFLSVGGSTLVDGVDTDVYYYYTGISQVHKGLEADFKYRPSTALMLRWYGTIGDWEYDGSTPYRIQVQDQGSGSSDVLERGEIDLTGTYVGNAPQVSTGFGLDVDVLKNLSFDIDMNIYTKLYGFVDTEDVIDIASTGDVYQAEKLPAYTLFDAGLTYDFSLGSNDLRLRGNVYNLFGENFINQKDQYGYYLGNGTTYNVSLRFNF
ncbi:TonB-dependent receptor [Maribacter sp. ANRC-HE7]|uniref:TonB-dependent receptor n=1 Tax=Maribacter aquimaris TaxID=2737171 RepID=A0ABR7V3W0_9FLAO|nr:TonB-dependent receptor [Maribacter aquimaris]MBD0779484.1 TonB-dependent receptor [Maribacter aquimaris]